MSDPVVDLGDALVSEMRSVLRRFGVDHWRLAIAAWDPDDHETSIVIVPPHQGSEDELIELVGMLRSEGHSIDRKAGS